MEDLIVELKSVLAVMDTIPIEGLVNQKKYVNCAERVRLVLEIMESAGKPDESTDKPDESTDKPEETEVSADG